MDVYAAMAAPISALPSGLLPRNSLNSRGSQLRLNWRSAATLAAATCTV
jgi:hypothetical protein